MRSASFEIFQVDTWMTQRFSDVIYTVETPDITVGRTTQGESLRSLFGLSERSCHAFQRSCVEQINLTHLQAWRLSQACVIDEV
jgi:hypothetical protein